MANPEHLKILNRGVKAWNKWLKDKPYITPDLSDADFTRADLRKYDLIRTNLAGAKLFMARLTGVVLCESYFGRANLRRANLSRANLIKANFFDADIMKANLSKADLGSAQFLCANMRGVNLGAANLTGADLCTVNLALTEVSKEYQIKQAQLEGKIEEISKHIRSLIDKPSTINIINAPQAKYLAIDGSTLNVQKTSNYYAYELRKAIEQEPKDSKSFAKVAKDEALGILDGALKDIAKEQVKKAAKIIIEMGKDLGPIIAKTAAYAFFSNMC